MGEADPVSEFRGRKERSELHSYTSHLPSGQHFFRLKLGNRDDIFKGPENSNCTNVCLIQKKFQAHRGFTEKYLNKYFLITYTVAGTWCLRHMDVDTTDKTHWLHGSYILLGWNANVYICEDQTFTMIFIWSLQGFPGDSDSKESARNVGDSSSIPGWRSSPGEENGNPLQYACLENPMDRGAWWVTLHGVAESAKTEQLALSLLVITWSSCSRKF